MDITVVDVETANSDYASLCQIGLVHVVDGKVVDEDVHLIDPEDHFAWINVSIHGIREEDVVGCPNFKTLWPKISHNFDRSYAVSYGPFDRTAISRVSEKYSMLGPSCPWLDVMRLVRRVWPEEFAKSGYGLKQVCKYLDIPLDKHHDALSDARAAASVLSRCLEFSKYSIDDAFSRCQKRARQNKYDFVGNPTADGALAGEEIVFTGALVVPRRVAADYAKAAGATVGGGVTKKTSILVIGNQDVRRVGEDGKSAKHEKAERLIKEKNMDIRIMSEADFLSLIHLEVVDADSVNMEDA